ncbi:MAG: low molecular weight protein arginine phosphatase [Leptolyngbya sp. SIO1D8]|nr:low molecular weight protein arginine phosphatase [Leptolyngbya sp. SIO1D8]
MNVLFICSGNTCRSPFAEALLHHKISCLMTTPSFAQSELDIQVKSAGTAASSGRPMSFAMEIILQEQGIESTHLSQRLHWDLIDWADLMLTMTRVQKALLISQMPELTPKLFTLNEYVGNQAHPDIEDPHGTDLESYRQCAAAIEVACDRLLNKLES